MQIFDTQAKFFIQPITAHIQDASTNNEAVAYGDGSNHGHAVLAGDFGSTAIQIPDPNNIAMGVFLQIGNGQRICLGILDNLSTQHPVTPGSKAIYNQDNSASIDLIPSLLKLNSDYLISIESPQGKINLKTQTHANIDVDELIRTINALKDSFNSLLTTLGTTLAGTYNLTPVPVPPVIAQTPPVGAFASLMVASTLPKP